MSLTPKARPSLLGVWWNRDISDLVLGAESLDTRLAELR